MARHAGIEISDDGFGSSSKDKMRSRNVPGPFLKMSTRNEVPAGLLLTNSSSRVCSQGSKEKKKIPLLLVVKKE